MGSLWDKPVFSVHTYSAEGRIALFAAAILAFVGFFIVVGKVVDWSSAMAAEAKRKDKRIELGSMVVAFLAFVFSVVGLVVSLNGQSDADARITKLEQAVKGMPGGKPTE